MYSIGIVFDIRIFFDNKSLTFSIHLKLLSIQFIGKCVKYIHSRICHQPSMYLKKSGKVKMKNSVTKFNFN